MGELPHCIGYSHFYFFDDNFLRVLQKFKQRCKSGLHLCCEVDERKFIDQHKCKFKTNNKTKKKEK